MIEPVQTVFALLFWFVKERNYTVQNTSTIVKPRRDPDEYSVGDVVLAKFRGKTYRSVIVRLNVDKEKLTDDTLKLERLLREKEMSPTEVMGEMGVTVALEQYRHDEPESISTETTTHKKTKASNKKDVNKRPHNDKEASVPNKKNKEKAELRQQKEAGIAASKLMAHKILEQSLPLTTSNAITYTQSSPAIITPATPTTSHFILPVSKSSNLSSTICTTEVQPMTSTPKSTISAQYTSTPVMPPAQTYSPYSMNNWQQDTNNQMTYMDSSWISPSDQWPDFSAGCASVFMAENLNQAPPNCGCLPQLRVLEQRVLTLESRIDGLIQSQSSERQGGRPAFSTSTTDNQESQERPETNDCVQTLVEMPVVDTTERPRSISQTILHHVPEERSKDVELVPGYGVKITISQLDACLRKAKSSGTALARLLLVVFFNEDTLSESTAKGTKTRRALDKDIINAIIKYVNEKFSCSERDIVQAINGKCTEVRGAQKKNK